MKQESLLHPLSLQGMKLPHNDYQTILHNLHTTTEEYSKINIRLGEILENRKISLNQLSFRAEMEGSQLRQYRDNKMQRLDINILLRLCYVLECDLSDLVEYIPPKPRD